MIAKTGRGESGRCWGKAIQLGECVRSKAPKVDGPGSKWTVRKGIKWKVYKSGRSTKNEMERLQNACAVKKGWKWTVLKSLWEFKKDESGQTQNAWTVKKGWKWTVSIYARGGKMMNFDDLKRLDFNSSRSFISGRQELRTCSVE